MATPPRGSPFKPRVTGDVVWSGVLWFLLPLAVYAGFKVTSNPAHDLERQLGAMPEARRNKERREKLVEVIKPDPNKDKELRDLMNKGRS